VEVTPIGCRFRRGLRTRADPELRALFDDAVGARLLNDEPTGPLRLVPHERLVSRQLMR
jgi:hypothetical protein